MTRPRILADPLAAIATCLLLRVAVWRVALPVWLPAPLRASKVLPATASVQASTGRVLVLAASADAGSGNALAVARRTWPRLPVEVHAVDGPPGRERLRQLAAAYGHDRLPIAILVDPGGRVLRVAAL